MELLDYMHCNQVSMTHNSDLILKHFIVSTELSLVHSTENIYVCSLLATLKGIIESILIPRADALLLI